MTPDERRVGAETQMGKQKPKTTTNEGIALRDNSEGTWRIVQRSRTLFFKKRR